MNKVLRGIKKSGKFFPWVNYLVYRVVYGGIYIDPQTEVIDRGGHLCYDRGNSVGAGSVLLLDAGSRIELGRQVWLGRAVHIEPGPGGKTIIGEGSSVQDRCRLLGDVKIGRNVLFAPNVYLSSGNHTFDLEPWLPIRFQDGIVAADDRYRDMRSKMVVIEDDCWIGVNAVIMRGVTIGKGSVIGANSVVTRDVAPYSVMAGAPARLLTNRLVFSPPALIKSSRKEDWPYFYTGFSIQKLPLEGVDEFELRADREFEIRLAGPDAKVSSIYLILKADRFPGGMCLKYGKHPECPVIAPGTNKYSFSVAGNTGEKHIFGLESLNRSEEVTISVLEAGYE